MIVMDTDFSNFMILISRFMRNLICCIKDNLPSLEHSFQDRLYLDVQRWLVEQDWLQPAVNKQIYFFCCKIRSSEEFNILVMNFDQLCQMHVCGQNVNVVLFVTKRENDRKKSSDDPLLKLLGCQNRVKLSVVLRGLIQNVKKKLMI